MPPCSLNYIVKDLSIGEAYSKLRELSLADLNHYSDKEIFEPNLLESNKVIKESFSFKQYLRKKPQPRPIYKINSIGLNKMTNQQNQNKVKTNSKEREDLCKVCLEDVREQDKGINCDICEFWHHANAFK